MELSPVVDNRTATNRRGLLLGLALLLLISGIFLGAIASLSRIAQRFYGNESLLSPILEANPFLLDRLDSLEVGEKLLIPNSDKSC
jgi:hypothetical protein